MSKLLNTEFTIEQLRRQIAELKQQQHTERLSIEEAEALLHIKLLDETNAKLDGFAAAVGQVQQELSNLRAGLTHMERANHALRESLGSAEIEVRAGHRHAATLAVLSVVMALATGGVLYGGWATLRLSRQLQAQLANRTPASSELKMEFSAAAAATVPAQPPLADDAATPGPVTDTQPRQADSAISASSTVLPEAQPSLRVPFTLRLPTELSTDPNNRAPDMDLSFESQPAGTESSRATAWPLGRQDYVGP